MCIRDRGWTVQIDGENAEPEQFGNALMAFDLEAGEHTIQMHYVPEGRKDVYKRQIIMY